MSLQHLISAGDAAAILDAIPFYQTVGVKIGRLEPKIQTHLPFNETHIGNRFIRSLHGGIVATFLDATALVTLVGEGKPDSYPKPVNITVDYLRPAKARDLYGDAEIVKLGRRIVSVRAMCWQSNRDQLVAQAMCHFLIGG